MFDSLSDRLSQTFATLRGKGRLSDKDIEQTCTEIREALLEADVALSVVNGVVEKVRERSVGVQVTPGLNPSQQIITIIYEELVAVLGGAARRITLAKRPPTVIMLAGLQGAGKTTLAGKLAMWLKREGHTPLLVACDLQRPNAVEQLSQVAKQVGVPIFSPEPGNGVGDPIKVARDGVELARTKLHDVVIVDTAGRLGVDAELMNQASKIRDAISPDEILFVVDAMIGQDALTTAEAFRDGVGFTGVVLTKLDGDARGGAALSLSSVIGKPIMFASSGEKLSDFDLFYPERMAQRILGMGDVASLAEQAKRAIGGDEIEAMEAKFASGQDFTLTDFLKQMQGLKQMGSMSKILGMLPGAAAMKKQIADIDESEIVRVEAIIQSMTPLERENPKILNGSRRARIAQGSGRKVSEVNSLMERFTGAQKMMRQMAKGGMPQLPPGMKMPMGMGGAMGQGMGPGMGQGMGQGMGALGGGFGAGKQTPQKKKSKSGNPAKRALEEGR
ncbi:MAG: signal recognition particle protein [Actinobacteria bacterium]|uniref:signal-recognition-particle GTPase n=1 Tax=freshwater metagenome TaxID=449393 RepID=A0A6J6MZE4_9ZZZZ|nr:signal recognition particle protein [Actinomycetota bacterium]